MLMHGSPLLNPSLKTYCMDSTLKSVKKMQEKNNLVKINAGASSPAFHFVGFFIFLSISVIGFQFCKRLQ